MPELPEVEFFRWYIEKHCLHKPIIQVISHDMRVLRDISFVTFKKALVGNSFNGAQRQGKYLIVDLKPSCKKLVFHFVLTGSLEYTKTKIPLRFSVIELVFQDDSILHFLSVRRFEKIWLVNDINDIEGIKELGPDALKISLRVFMNIMAKNSSKNVKVALMNQKIIAGIGNEYSDEILYQAKVDPRHQIKNLSENQLKMIHKQMHAVLKYAIKVEIEGKPFAKTYLQAHRHIDMICPKDKQHHLEKVTIAGRTSYFCPAEQK